MKIILSLLTIGLYAYMFYTNERLEKLENHLNIAAQAIQTLQSEDKYINDIMKESNVTTTKK